jgi:prevent-host-death family protein
MRTVGAYQAKTHLSELLDAVGRGDRVVITRHGHPIAVLAPYDAVSNPDIADAIAALSGFRRGRRLDAPVRELIEEGRR